MNAYIRSLKHVSCCFNYCIYLTTVQSSQQAQLQQQQQQHQQQQQQTQQQIQQQSQQQSQQRTQFKYSWPQQPQTQTQAQAQRVTATGSLQFQPIQGMPVIYPQPAMVPDPNWYYNNMMLYPVSPQSYIPAQYAQVSCQY